MEILVGVESFFAENLTGHLFLTERKPSDFKGSTLVLRGTLK